jgi:hypothetical protein
MDTRTAAICDYCGERITRAAAEPRYGWHHVTETGAVKHEASPPPERQTPAQYLDRALDLVESRSIRAWANQPGNRKAWLKEAKRLLDRGEPVLRFSTYIVVTAMG